MSKTSKRKTGDSNKSNISSSSKDYQKRPSVFERLGTKASNISSSATTSLSVNVSNQDSFCRNWAQTGSCPYGKSCKLSNTHTLISPSKRSSKKEVDTKQNRGRSEEKRVHSNLTRRVSPEVNWESWDQTDLEYEDEKALEKRRQLLQRELELQMKKETRKQDPSKRRCSSTSSCSSSSSGSTSSTASSSESSVSTLRRNEIKKKRQSTSSPSESERPLKKNMVKTLMHKDSPARKSTSNKKISPPRKTNRRKSQSPLPRKPVSPPKQKPQLSLSGSSSSGNRRRESPTSRRGTSVDRKSISQHRSSSRNRRGRSPKSRPRPRSPDSKSSSRAPPLPPPQSLIRNSSDRKKEDDRKGIKDDSVRRDRKTDFRDKREQDEGRRSREKAREIRETAREKERLEALERCRERQREREQLAKEKERAREERERERVKRERERRDRRGTSRERRRPAASDDKRHERIYDRYERKVGERERSYDRERARDRALERVMERKSVDRNRDRSRESYDRPYESRRIIQDEKPYNSPFRGNDRGRNNYEPERERDRVATQEVRNNTGYNSAGESDRRPRRDRQTWDNSGGGSYQDPQRDKREWEQREYHDTTREWDNRSRCRGDEGGEEWAGYNTGGSGNEWHSGRSHLLSISHHEDRRVHHPTEISEKEHAMNDPVKKEKEQVESSKRLNRGSGDEMEEAVKRTRTEEPSSLQEELSDISDDADDILNREDVEFLDNVTVEERRTNGGGSGGAVVEEEIETAVNEPQVSQPQEEQPVTAAAPQAVTSGTTLTDDEHIVSLDFEEISDDELEEESKVNKGSSVGDALGVDWTSLMAECRPQRKQQESSAHTYWSTANILTRIGISFQMATPAVCNNIQHKYNLAIEKDQDLSHIAALQRALAEKRQRRASLVTNALEHKQALSARSDIYVRRQLCGLPVVSLESHQTAGFCQWAV